MCSSKPVNCSEKYNFGSLMYRYVHMYRRQEISFLILANKKNVLKVVYTGMVQFIWTV